MDEIPPEVPNRRESVFIVPDEVSIFNHCGLSDQLIVHLNLAENIRSKKKARSEASRQNHNSTFFEAKLRFALLVTVT